MTATTTLKDQLRRLVEIQAIDVHIYAMKLTLRERPAEIEALRQECEAKKSTLKKLEDKLKGIQVQQKDLDNDLKTKEAGIAKMEASLALLKTNKEYQARLIEIESLNADKSQIEEKILMGFDEVEAARQAVEAERAVVAQYDKDFQAKKKQGEYEMAIMQDQLKVKESQRGRLTPDVRPDILGRYDRIVQNKEGVAIVAIKDQACGGCYMHVTEQKLNTLKICDQMVYCDQCARILYLADEL